MTVSLSPLQHKSQLWIAISFPISERIASVVRRLPNRSFSKTHKAWLVPLSKDNYKTIYHALHPICDLHTEAMKTYFLGNNAPTQNTPLQEKKLAQQTMPQQKTGFSSTNVIHNNKVPVSAAKVRVSAAKVRVFTNLQNNQLKTHHSKQQAPPTKVLVTNNHPAFSKIPVTLTHHSKPITQDAKPFTHHSKPITHNSNAHVLPTMEQHLILKGYSPNTRRTYLGEMSQLLQTLKAVPAQSLSTQRVKDYLQYCHTTLQLKENTLHSRINALKFYYEQVLGREKFFWEIPRPKKPFQIPHFFNQDEIVAILKGTENIKHKAMLMLAYSSGLRVSEVVAIKTYNIDSKRMCIKIEQAKGKKDRMVTLSPILLVILREYFMQYKPQKNGYLFQGQATGEAYSTRSLQLVLSAAKEKAGIMKPGSIHALRHSFATHLLDKGIDVTMIQKLLGHNDLKTTMRYLHTTNKDLLKIISPLDNLVLD